MVVFLVLALITLGIVAIGVVVHLTVSVVNSYSSALPVPTPNSLIPEILTALDLPTKGQFVELGCGDGRILAAAVALQPGIDAVGIDNNPVTLAWAYLRLQGKAKLVQGNLMKHDVARAQRVFTYLSPGMMARLESSFSKYLPSGARLVSLQFPLPGRRPDQEIELLGGKPHAKRLYIYNY